MIATRRVTGARLWRRLARRFPAGHAAARGRREQGLPPWGLQEGQDYPGAQFLADIRARREQLYTKLGRAPIGSGQTYLATYELHPDDLARQAELEAFLATGNSVGTMQASHGGFEAPGAPFGGGRSGSSYLRGHLHLGENGGHPSYR